MSKKTSKGMDRRTFVKRFSAGAVGGAVLMNVPPGATAGEHGDGDNSEARKGKQLLRLKVNGKAVKAMVEPRTTLLELIRDHLGLTGTKQTCNRGQCGACTVVLDGRAVYSCHMLALDADGGEVTTIEGLLHGEELHPLQQAFVDHDGLQCGFCTPGQVMAAQALLMKHPNPTREQAMTGMSGNLCRCSAYPNIIDSVLGASGKQG